MKLEEYTKKYGNKEVDEKKLNELLGIRKDSVWKPVRGDMYYVVLLDGNALSVRWHDSNVDEDAYSFGNCFQTKEQARFEVDRRKFLAFFERSLRENEETQVNLDDAMQNKFALSINSGSDTIHITCFSSTYTMPKRYITTNREYLRQFALTHSKELLKYYFERGDK